MEEWEQVVKQLHRNERAYQGLASTVTDVQYTFKRRFFHRPKGGCRGIRFTLFMGNCRTDSRE
jgi:hypothetical protein